MKSKTLILTFAMTAALTVAMAMTSATADAQKRERNVSSNHSISAQLIGLEYSYEQCLGGNWSLIGRAGLAPVGAELNYDLESASYNVNLLPTVTLEPRIYTSMRRRIEMGRDTYNNAADFVSFRSQVFLTGDGVNLGFTPMYGIRRSSGIHWMHEFTFGARVNIGEYNGLTPHLQYRIGFVF